MMQKTSLCFGQSGNSENWYLCVQ